jgi:hypothetical protein
MMRTGLPDGDPGDEVLDLLSDTIRTEAKVVSDGAIPGSEFGVPSTSMHMAMYSSCGATEPEWVAHLMSHDDAKSYVMCEGGWPARQGVRMSSENLWPHTCRSLLFREH